MRRMMIALAVLLTAALGQIVVEYPVFVLDSAFGDGDTNLSDSSRFVMKYEALTRADTFPRDSMFFDDVAGDTTKDLWSRNIELRGYIAAFQADTSSADGVPAIAAPGSGLLFSPKFGYLIAGYNDAAFWSKDSTGAHSVKFGVNNVTADTSGALSGIRNRATGIWSVVAGGHDNHATGSLAGIHSGYQHLASGAFSFVGGGAVDTASGEYAAIVGGITNVASGRLTFIGGGNSNIASGEMSVVPGGFANTAADSYDVALGRNACADGPNAVLFNLSATPETLAQANTFAVMGGNVGIGTVAPVITVDVGGGAHVQDSLVVGHLSADSASGRTKIYDGYVCATDSIKTNGNVIAGGYIKCDSVVANSPLILAGDSIVIRNKAIIPRASFGGFGVGITTDSIANEDSINADDYLNYAVVKIGMEQAGTISTPFIYNGYVGQRLTLIAGGGTDPIVLNQAEPGSHIRSASGNPITVSGENVYTLLCVGADDWLVISQME